MKTLLEKFEVDDYVFSSDVSFMSKNNISDFNNKVWPESHEIIIKAVSTEICDSVFNAIVEYKKENKIKNKIKIVVVPLIKYG